MANQERFATGGGPNLFEKEDAAITDKRPTERKSFDNTRAFLSELTAPVRVFAKGEAVDPKDYFPSIKDRAIFAKERYYRRLEISSRYASEFTESADKVAERFGVTTGERVTRERVRQIFAKTLVALWESAPDELKQKYPPESLDTDKQNSIRYGVRGEVVAALESGKDARALIARFGTRQVHEARETSRRFGVELPYVQKTLPEWLVGFKNPDATNQQIQELLDEVKKNKCHKTLLKDGFIISLSQVARLAGLYPDFSDIWSIHDKLRAEGLPAERLAHKIKRKDGREIVYYYNFIAAKDMAGAIDILSGAAEFAHLKRNPVEQVRGPAGRIPSTTELRFLKKYDKYDRVGNLILQIRGRRLGRNNKVKLADIIGDSPVPIYKMLRGKGFYYPTSQKEEFREYLTLRLREFGLI